MDSTLKTPENQRDTDSRDDGLNDTASQAVGSRNWFQEFQIMREPGRGTVRKTDERDHWERDGR